MQDLGFLQSPRLQALQKQAETTQQEADKRSFLIMLVKEVINAINETTVAKIEGGVDVNNLDEVTAALRNELARANKPVTEILKKLNLSTQDQTSVIQQIEKKAIDDFNKQYQTVIVKRVKDQVEVTNLSDLAFPAQVGINNLSDLEAYFKDLADKIEAMDLVVNIPAPQVTVTPAPVFLPDNKFPEINIPVVDLNPLITAIKTSLNRLSSNSETRPLAVRLTDGQNWIKELIKAQERTSQAVAAFAGGSDQVRILDANRNIVNFGNTSAPSTVGDGTATVTTAGTKVQLSATSVPCRYVIVVGNTGNTGKVYLGGATIATARGRPLNQEQSEKIDIDNLNKVYIDADNNTDGVTFTYVA